MQRNRMPSRLLSSQFDNFLVVHVSDAGEVGAEVRVVAALSEPQFTPDQWRAINTVPPTRPQVPLLRQVWDTIGSPKRLLGIGFVLAIVFAAGWGAARRLASRT
jgi:hypothetical protein